MQSIGDVYSDSQSDWWCLTVSWHAQVYSSCWRWRVMLNYILACHSELVKLWYERWLLECQKKNRICVLPWYGYMFILIRNGYWFGTWELSLWLALLFCMNECPSTCNFHIDGALFYGAQAMQKLCLTAPSCVILGTMQQSFHGYYLFVWSVKSNYST